MARRRPQRLVTTRQLFRRAARGLQRLRDDTRGVVLEFLLDGPASKLRPLWSALTVGAPVAIAGASLAIGGPVSAGALIPFGLFGGVFAGPAYVHAYRSAAAAVVGAGRRTGVGPLTPPRSLLTGMPDLGKTPTRRPTLVSSPKPPAPPGSPGSPPPPRGGPAGSPTPSPSPPGGPSHPGVPPPGPPLGGAEETATGGSGVRSRLSPAGSPPSSPPTATPEATTEAPAAKPDYGLAP